MSKLPKKVLDAIKEFQKIGDERKEAVSTQQEKAEKLSAELAEAKAELIRLMDEAVRNPSDEIEEKEIECRQRIAKLEFAVTGAQERARRAQSLDQSDQKEAALNAMRIAKEEADKKFVKEIDKKMKAIEEAKTAYLQALADYETFRKECINILEQAAIQTNPSLRDKIGNVRASNHNIAWGYRDHPQADGNKYTVFPDEINTALKHGVVKQDGRRL